MLVISSHEINCSGHIAVLAIYMVQQKGGLGSSSPIHSACFFNMIAVLMSVLGEIPLLALR